MITSGIALRIGYENVFVYWVCISVFLHLHVLYVINWLL